MKCDVEHCPNPLFLADHQYTSNFLVSRDPVGGYARYEIVGVSVCGELKYRLCLSCAYAARAMAMGDSPGLRVETESDEAFFLRQATLGL